MSDEYPVPYTHAGDGTPVYLTEDGSLIDAEGTEYELEDDTPTTPTSTSTSRRKRRSPSSTATK